MTCSVSVQACTSPKTFVAGLLMRDLRSMILATRPPPAPLREVGSNMRASIQPAPAAVRRALFNRRRARSDDVPDSVGSKLPTSREQVAPVLPAPACASYSCSPLLTTCIPFPTHLVPRQWCRVICALQGELSREAVFLPLAAAASCTRRKQKTAMTKRQRFSTDMQPSEREGGSEGWWVEQGEATKTHAR